MALAPRVRDAILATLPKLEEDGRSRRAHRAEPSGDSAAEHMQAQLDRLVQLHRPLAGLDEPAVGYAPEVAFIMFELCPPPVRADRLLDKAEYRAFIDGEGPLPDNAKISEQLAATAADRDFVRALACRDGDATLGTSYRAAPDDAWRALRSCVGLDALRMRQLLAAETPEVEEVLRMGTDLVAIYRDLCRFVFMQHYRSLADVVEALFCPLRDAIAMATTEQLAVFLAAATSIDRSLPRISTLLDRWAMTGLAASRTRDRADLLELALPPELGVEESVRSNTGASNPPPAYQSPRGYGTLSDWLDALEEAATWADLPPHRLIAAKDELEPQVRRDPRKLPELRLLDTAVSLSVRRRVALARWRTLVCLAEFRRQALTTEDALEPKRRAAFLNGVRMSLARGHQLRPAGDLRFAIEHNDLAEPFLVASSKSLQSIGLEHLRNGFEPIRVPIASGVRRLPLRGGTPRADSRR